MDSVTANFRGEFGGTTGSTSIASRSSELFDLGVVLKGLADRFGLCVVVTNQVTERMKPAWDNSTSTDSDLRPSLGLSWGNVINTRLRLTKRRTMYHEASAMVDPEVVVNVPTARRRIEVEFAPHLARGMGSDFQIREGGIVGLPD
jgi:DNA-repair protein XRCC3